MAHASGQPVAALFQPHRFSRTQHFVAQFADALALADRVALLPVYAASEAPIEGVDSGLIAEALRAKGLDEVRVLSGPEEIPDWLDTTVTPGHLLVTLGAGDIGRRVGEICAHLDGRAAP